MATKLSESGKCFRAYLKETMVKPVALQVWAVAHSFGYLTEETEPEDYAEIVGEYLDDYPYDLFDYFSEWEAQE